MQKTIVPIIVWLGFDPFRPVHNHKRPMEQQEEAPERKRVQVSVKDALAQGGQRRSVGGEKRGPQETEEVQGENKRPRENAPQGCPWTFP